MLLFPVSCMDELTVKSRSTEELMLWVVGKTFWCKGDPISPFCVFSPELLKEWWQKKISSPHAKHWLLGKDSHDGRDSAEKGNTEWRDGWMSRLDGHEFEYWSWWLVASGVESRTTTIEWTELKPQVKNLKETEKTNPKHKTKENHNQGNSVEHRNPAKKKKNPRKNAQTGICWRLSPTFGKTINAWVRIRVAEWD